MQATTQDEQIRPGIDNACGVQLTLYADGQAFTAKLIKDVQRSKSSAIVGTVMSEV